MRMLVLKVKLQVEGDLKFAERADKYLRTKATEIKTHLPSADVTYTQMEEVH